MAFSSLSLKGPALLSEFQAKNCDANVSFIVQYENMLQSFHAYMLQKDLGGIFP